MGINSEAGWTTVKVVLAVVDATAAVVVVVVAVVKAALSRSTCDLPASVYHNM